MEFDKAYDPQRIEPHWAEWWVESGIFHADPHAPGPRFSLAVPPPNVTGSLHIGHMLDHTVIDTATRYGSTQTRALSRLIRDTPALSAGEQAKYEHVERALAKALADRKSLPEIDTACRVTAATAIGILKLAVETWLAGTDSGPEKTFKAAFTALRRIAEET